MAINASIYVVAAITGCMWQESTLNPNIWESGIVVPWDTVHYWDSQGRGIGGFGLGQWTNTRESNGIAWRLLDYYNWATELGYDPHDGNAQLQYILHEDIWFNISHVGSNAQNLTQFLTTNSTNLDGLVEDFLRNWEGGVPGTSIYKLEERKAFARRTFAYIREHKDDDPSTVRWQSSSNYVIPTSETLNNALCFYMFFQGYDPGGDPGPGPSPTPTTTRKMPLWMYLRRLPF